MEARIASQKLTYLQKLSKLDHDTILYKISKLHKLLNKIAKFRGGKCINKFTGKVIKAIIPVHVFGHPCDIQNIIKIAKKFNLIVVEDAAEALGSFYKQKHLGTFGDAGCISFNGNKIITTGGGGMVITNKKKLAKKNGIKNYFNNWKLMIKSIDLDIISIAVPPKEQPKIVKFCL